MNMYYFTCDCGKALLSQAARMLYTAGNFAIICSTCQGAVDLKTIRRLETESAVNTKFLNNA